LLALLLVYMFCPLRLGVVCGTSMEPTFRSGQPILIDRGYYRRHAVRRGDVVLLRHDGQMLIKRIFAVAGDAFHVMIFPDDAGVTRFLIHPDELSRLRRSYRRSTDLRFSRMRVPEGRIYVLGDNSNASIDSRDFGMIPLTSIVGRVPDPGASPTITQAAALIPAGGSQTQAQAASASGKPQRRWPGVVQEEKKSRVRLVRQVGS